jgi:CRISPR-associated protein (TIGR02710 family)
MTIQELPQPCQAILVSLGGSPEPVIHTLNQQQPEYIGFFVSLQTAQEIQEIIRALSYRCRDFDRIVTPSAEDLEACYQALSEALPAMLARWRVTADTLIVDYTGGTKTMSAALVLATIEGVHRYSYVGGVERDKGGVGVVIGGRERMLHVHNPWKVWAQEERKRLRLYFAAARYDTALQELQRLLAHAETKDQDLLRAIANAIEGYRDWDNFRYKDALPKLGQALRFLKPYARGARQESLARFVLAMEANVEFLQRLTAANTRDEAYILDLIANAERRARVEAKYEDAVARLYSALERAARFRLRRFPYRINTEDIKPGQLPAVLQAEYEQKYREARDGKIKVPLMAAYCLLEALGDDLGRAFTARQDEIGQLLSLRNLSPLGHGENPVGREGYERFRTLLMELVALDDSALPRFPELYV